MVVKTRFGRQKKLIGDENLVGWLMMSCGDKFAVEMWTQQKHQVSLKVKWDLLTFQISLEVKNGCISNTDGNQKSGEKTHLGDGVVKNLVNNGINYQPQLVNAGFLNHQQ